MKCLIQYVLPVYRHKKTTAEVVFYCQGNQSPRYSHPLVQVS
ncbi:Unknown protein sequence [Pseudomonas syringae pv. syringae]|uniref:Uncharacterized protein n=2 Tax=Pseudomonas syringae group TaxID=136849 RepID=A0A3M5WJS9_9PSED|nr:Unknown protein sequence [Pseudomonas syringae pv. aceris]KPB18826.1 Unknown protein sequence [Pseudomonas syringae pv. syringae]KPW12772.1 hypothetical protein ALO91_103287 [Pseudomonas syringae pv. aceris]RMR51270.1 hypothetical protein ALP85_102547 [Pseudomonas syringae pv. syringae]RMU70931.1 hypothetical protein ALP23_102478 [Pseudomonas syringae pv. apii]